MSSIIDWISSEEFLILTEEKESPLFLLSFNEFILICFDDKSFVEWKEINCFLWKRGNFNIDKGFRFFNDLLESGFLTSLLRISGESVLILIGANLLNENWLLNFINFLWLNCFIFCSSFNLYSLNIYIYLLNNSEYISLINSIIYPDICSSFIID